MLFLLHFGAVLESPEWVFYSSLAPDYFVLRHELNEDVAVGSRFWEGIGAFCAVPPGWVSCKTACPGVQRTAAMLKLPGAVAALHIPSFAAAATWLFFLCDFKK